MQSSEIFSNSTTLFVAFFGRIKIETRDIVISNSA